MLKKMLFALWATLACLALVQAEEFRGKVKSVDSDKKIVVVTVDDKDMSFTVTDKTKLYTIGAKLKGKKKGTPPPEVLLSGVDSIKVDNFVVVTTDKVESTQTVDGVEKKVTTDVVTSIKVDPPLKKKKKDNQ